MARARMKALAQVVDDYCELDVAIKELETQRAALREKLISSKQVTELKDDLETVLVGSNHQVLVSGKVKETKVDTKLALKVIPEHELPLVATFSVTALKTLFKLTPEVLDRILTVQVTETRRLKVLS